MTWAHHKSEGMKWLLFLSLQTVHADEMLQFGAFNPDFHHLQKYLCTDSQTTIG